MLPDPYNNKTRRHTQFFHSFFSQQHIGTFSNQHQRPQFLMHSHSRHTQAHSRSPVGTYDLGRGAVSGAHVCKVCACAGVADAPAARGLPSSAGGWRRLAAARQLAPCHITPLSLRRARRRRRSAEPQRKMTSSEDRGGAQNIRDVIVQNFDKNRR